MSNEKQNSNPTPAELQSRIWRNQYILDNSLDGFCLFNRDGFICETNRGFNDLLGYSTDELKNKHISELEAIDDIDTVNHKIENLRRSGSTRFETKLKHKNGQRIPLEVSANYCIRDGEEFFFAFFRDQSERHAIAKELLESEEKYRALVEASPFALAIFQDDKAAFVNNAMVRLLNLEKPEDLIGQHVLFPVPDRDKEPLMNILRKHLNGDPTAPTQFEANFVKADGSEFPAEVVVARGIYKGRPSVQLVVIDVSQREEILRELAKSRQAFQDLVENIHDVIYSLDINGNITYVGPSVERNFSYTPAELIGRSFKEITHPDDIARAQSKFNGVLENKFGPSEYRFFAKNGEIRWVRSYSRPSFKDGIMNGIQGVLIDITEQRKIEDALRESETRFRGLFDHYLNGYALCEIVTDDTGNLSDVIILEVNKALEEIKPIDAKSLIGKSIFTIFPVSLDFPAFDMIRELLRTNKPVHREIKSSSLDRWLEIELYITEKNRVAVIFADITQRKNAEAALRDSEERFRGIFNHYLYGYGLGEAISDDLGKVTDFRVLEINAAMARILKIPAENAISRRIVELLPGSKSASVFDMIAGVLQSGIPTHREIYSDVINGWFDISIYKTAANQFGCVVADISERKNAEAALRQSEERYRAIWENSPMGICLTDRDGIYHFVNRAYCEIYGYTEQELVGYSFMDKIMAPGHPRAEKSLYSIKFDSPHPESITESNIFIRKNGEPIWIEHSSDFIYRDNRAEFMVTMNIDVTKIKKARMQLAESEEKYRLLIENAAELILNFNAQGTVTLMNKSAARHLGGISDEFVGKPLSEIFPQSAAEQFSREITRVIQTGKAVNGEMNWIIQDERKWFSANIQPLLGNGKQIMGAMVVATDITAQKINAAWQDARINFLRRLRNALSIDDCLKFGCLAIYEAGLFRRAVLTLHNEKREITHLGQIGMYEQSLETARNSPAPTLETARLMTQEKFRISHSFFVPAETGVIAPPEKRLIPQDGPVLNRTGAWVLGDELFVPIIGSANVVEGWLSVDTPFDGKRPSLEVVHYLEEIVDVASKQYRQLQSLEDLRAEQRALEEKNITLRVVLDQIKEDKDEIRQKIASIVSQVLLPALNKLVKKDNTIHETHYSILKTGLPELITVSGAFIDAFSKLSPREREIYNLVKAGLTSKEIAAKLHIAVATVQKHREIIRKKLGIRGQRNNLNQYLSKL